MSVLLWAWACEAQTWTVTGPDSTWTREAPTAGAVLDSLSAHGFLAARVTDAGRREVVAGPIATVREIRVVGEEPTGIASWRIREGAQFRYRDLLADVEQAATELGRAGFVDAVVSPSVEVSGDGRFVDVSIVVDRGARADVVAVEVAGARGPGRAFASRQAGVTGPTDPDAVDLPAVRASLEASGLYASVGEPILAIDGQRDLIIQVPVVEAPPGTLDLVLGYLPPGGGGGGIVGRGRVDVRNPFGGGRRGFVELERSPGLASSFGASLADPFVFGTPIGLGVTFLGDARDSTLSRQRVAVDVRYAIDVGLDLIGVLARETVRPGTFGDEQVENRPRIRATDDVLFGVGLEAVRLDRVRSPRRGLEARIIAEQAQRGGVSVEDGAQSRRRLTIESRAYVPTWSQQTVVLGLDGTVTQQQVASGALVDEGDLVRFGGATSFRGYDEDALLARSYIRGVAEYRVLFDQASFAFVFADVGGLDRPVTPTAPAERAALSGYGAGLRVQTALGLATLTYALNPDLSLGQGKVHVGINVGI